MATLRIHPPLLWTAGILWPTVCTATVAARFVARKMQGVRYGWDDWLIIPAWILTCTLSVALLVGVGGKAMGYPTPVVDPDQSLTATSRQQTLTRKVYWIYLLLHTPALAFIKLSCVAFYRRAFRPGQNKVTSATIWALTGIILAWGISFTVVGLFACGTLKHLNYLWTSLENQAKCTVNQLSWQQGLAVSDVIVDLMLFIFPVPHVWQLNMERARKIGLSVIFFFGSLSIAASTIRLVIIYEALNVEFSSRIDEDFLSTAGTYFLLLEAGFGIIAVCLPALASVLKIGGVQTFFNNISQVFSLRSQSSARKESRTPSCANQGVEQDDIHQKPYAHGELSDGKPPGTHGYVIALEPASPELVEEDRVRVTKTIELLNGDA